MSVEEPVEILLVGFGEMVGPAQQGEAGSEQVRFDPQSKDFTPPPTFPGAGPRFSRWAGGHRTWRLSQQTKPSCPPSPTRVSTACRPAGVISSCSGAPARFGMIVVVMRPSASNWRTSE